MTRNWICSVLALIVLSTATAFAKHTDDVVVLKNGDRMTGEIKGLQRGELKIKADYMAEAVRLDWTRIAQVESKSTFIISLVDGQLFTNVIHLLPGNSNGIRNFVIGPANSNMRVHQSDVIRIIPIEPGFWRRLEGSVDFGLSYTSGNEQYQTQLNATSTYRTGDHSFTASIESAFSGQPEGESTTRKQFSFDYRKQLTRRSYAGGLFDLLQSDQQSLNLRTSVGGLLGLNVHQSERSRFSIFGGIVGTRENYSISVGEPKTTNADALAGIDFTTFRFKSTDIRTRLNVFPSLTTPGRMRFQATSDMQIKIVNDLYWGFHVYENFDSKPPVRADRNELGISTSLGWKF